MLFKKHMKAVVRFYLGRSKLPKIAFEMSLRKLQLQSRLDAADALAKTNESLFICAAYASDSHFVTVFEENPLLVALNSNDVLSVVALLQETSKLRWRGTANGA